MDEISRTNNMVDSLHRQLGSLLSSHHATIWRFVKGLQKEQNPSEVKIEQFIAGQDLPNSQRIYRETAERIKIVLEYGERIILEFLRGSSHNISLQSHS